MTPGEKLGGATLVARILSPDHAEEEIWEAASDRGARRLVIAKPAPAAGVMDRFLTTRARLAAVSHPSIVRTLDAGRLVDGRLWIAREAPAGKTLAAARSGARWEVAVALEVLEHLAGGLAALHAAGFAHGPIHPRAVILGTIAGHKQALLTDVGFSALRTSGDLRVDRRADVRAFGRLAEAIVGAGAPLHFIQLVRWTMAEDDYGPDMTHVLTELLALRQRLPPPLPQSA
jgi:hypothetical protein